jgi:Putative auto-transporter adhesin, head GIN domain
MLIILKNQYMKKILFPFVLLIAFISTVCAQDMMMINDKNAELRSVGSFTGIQVSNAIELIIKQGNEDAVIVSANEEKYRNRIKTEVRNGVLNIWYDNEGLKNWWKGDDKKLRAYVSVKNLNLINASGATDVKIDGVLHGTKLKVELSGASGFKGELQYDELKINQSGASDATVKGKVTNLEIDLSGASDFKGFDLVAENCDVQTSGASDVKITVNNEFKVNASGASDVEYKGNAKVSELKTTGASSLRKRGTR